MHSHFPHVFFFFTSETVTRSDFGFLDGDSLIHLAGCFHAVCSRVVNLGIDINHRNNYGVSALFNSIWNGDLETSLKLMIWGADIFLPLGPDPSNEVIDIPKSLYPDPFELMLNRFYEPLKSRIAIIMGALLMKWWRTGKILSLAMASEGSCFGELPLDVSRMIQYQYTMMACQEFRSRINTRLLEAMGWSCISQELNVNQ